MAKHIGQSGSFSLSLSEFAKQATDAIDASLREIVISIGGSLIRMSPVDTGRFRGNWQFSIDAPASGTLSNIDREGDSTLARIVGDSIEFKAGTTAYIVNNLPYALVLEFGGYNGPTEKVTDDGYSRQAPKGMVRVTKARFQRIVEEAIRNNSV
ncbi:HK97 gp10 family phage protein [Pseudomonas sp.]|uniref:HK97 gp10 family phage protein n=1 Tax=Pseudomonas sp. TaxID=306 RepID=UPI002FCB9C55